MNTDIDNWVEFLNDTTSRANISNISFNQNDVTKDLKMTAIPMIKQFIGEIRGRKLTTVLQSLEKSFKLVGRQLKLERSFDEFRKLSFLALSNVVVEILREMRVDAYSKGKDFDPILFLDNYESKIFTKTQTKKNSKKKNDAEEETEEELEEDSDEDSDSDFEPKYLDDDEEEESEEDSEVSEDSDESEDYVEEDLSNKRKRGYLIIRGKKAKREIKKRPKLDLEFMNSLNTTLEPKSYEDQAFSHFTKFNDKKKEEFLTKFKTIVESDTNIL